MENSGLSRIDHQPPTLRDVVLDRLRNAIIDGVFAPGERLVERVLCERLGVSRTVVRETLRYLDAEGLVEHVPHRGPVVATMTWNEACQIYDIRRALETAAAMSCAEHLTDAIAQQLRAALSEIEAASQTQEPGALFKASTQFYGVIFKGAGHDIAWEVVQRLNGRISRLRIMTLTSSEREVSGPEHMRRICSAITTRNPEAALTAVETHLTDAKAIARRLLAQETSGETKP